MGGALKTVEEINDRVYGSWIQGNSSNLKLRDMYDYCSINNGEFSINNGFAKNSNYFDYLWQSYLTENPIMRSGEIPFKPDMYGRMRREFSGIYSCQGGDRPFTVFAIYHRGYNSILVTLEDKYDPEITQKHSVLRYINHFSFGKKYDEIRDDY